MLKKSLKTRQNKACLKNLLTEKNSWKCKGVSNLLESRFEFEGHVSVVFGFFHDFADHSLLAVKIVIVEFLIKVLEHWDPLDDVQTAEVICVIGRPKFSWIKNNFSWCPFDFNFTMRRNLLNWCNLVTNCKKLRFYVFGVVRIY